MARRAGRTLQTRAVAGSNPPGDPGKQQGKQQGKQEGEVNLILRLLSKRFGEVPSQLKMQIEKLSLEQLEALTEVLLDFASLDDLVGWLQNLEVSEK